MKYLKTYEDIKIPQKGDYVVLDPYFFNNRIGKVIEVFYNKPMGTMIDGYSFLIQVYVLGEKGPQMQILLKHILYFSSNKEDCVVFIDANNYNL